MKKLFLITIMLLSTLACAYEVDLHMPPPVSGKYSIIVPNSMRYNIGDDLTFTTWNNSYDSVECHIIHSHFYYDENKCWKFGSSCFEYTLDCDVQERAQFYNANYTASITYTELKGHRSDGTLKWSRDRIGSTDIYCYDRNGMTIIKHVNNPYRCK